MDEIASLPAVGLAGLAIALVCAGFVKGTIGVGMPIVGLPLLCFVLDVRVAVLLLSLPLLLTNLPQALEGGETTRRLRSLTPVLLGMVPGLVAGAYLISHVAARQAALVAGGSLVLVAVITLVAPRFIIADRHAARAGASAGFLGGIMGGVAAMPGPLVFTYLLARGLRGTAFTGEASMFLVLSALLLYALLAASMPGFTWHDGVVSAAATVPVALGMLMGQRVRDRLPAELFRRLVLVAVLAAGVQLLERGLLG